MFKILRAVLPFILISSILLFSNIAAFAHGFDTMATSTWVIGKNDIQITLELSTVLLTSVKEVQDKYYRVDACTDQELQQIAVEMLQPYVDKKLSVRVNGMKYPVSVNSLTRGDGYIYVLVLSVNNIGANLKKSENSFRIEYQMFFEETNDSHYNLGVISLADTSDEGIQYVFSPSLTVWDGTVNFEAASKDKANSSVEAITTNTDISDTPDSTDSGTSSQTAAQKPGPTAGNERVSREPSQQSGSTPGNTVSYNEKTSKKKDQPNSGNYILSGFKSILSDYGHILFLMVLIIAGISYREALKVFAAFAITNSITLYLAAFQIFKLNPRFAEEAAALLICYIALESSFREKLDKRWILALVFGLIHGFGSANVLHASAAPLPHPVISMLSFNSGVIASQLMVFLIALPVLNRLKHRLQFKKAVFGASITIFFMSFIWLIQKLLNL